MTRLLKTLQFWLVFLFSIPQALWVRKTAPRFAPAQGETHGTWGTATEAGVSLRAVGDSIVAGVGAEQYAHSWVAQTACCLQQKTDNSVQWSADGLIGRAAKDLLTLGLEDNRVTEPDVFLVSIGVNDVTTLTSPARFRLLVTQWISLVTAHYPNARLVFLGLPPMHIFPLLPWPLRSALGIRAEMLDSELALIARKLDHVTHLVLPKSLPADQFSDDGFHPGTAGYQQLGLLTAEAIHQKMQQS